MQMLVPFSMNLTIESARAKGYPMTVTSTGYIITFPDMDVPALDITGPKGDKGDKGDRGDVGATGATGAQGRDGLPGATGARGLQGVKGDKGDTGDSGATGAQGIQGIQGIQGPQGIMGETGLGTAEQVGAAPIPDAGGYYATDTINGALQQTGAQLARSTFNRLGLVALPDPFDQLGFDLYVDFDGVVKHTYNIATAITGTSIFVSELTGVDTNDGLASGTAVRTLEVAIQKGNAHASTHIIVEFLDKMYTRNYSGIVTAPTKNYTFRASNAGNETLLTGAERNLAWTADGDAYKATRSAVVQVCDTDYRDFNGIPKALKNVASIALCQAELGTWYTNGTSVWIRRWNDLAPTGSGAGTNILVLLSTAGCNLTLNDKTLIFQNLMFLKPTAATPGDSSFRLVGNAGTTLIHSNVNFAYGARNGMATVGVGKVLSFNCVASYNGSDGFNYKAGYIAAPYEFAFEYNCMAYGNGALALDGAGKNNASTAHEGMTIVRAHTVGYDCDGPIIADVNGCDSYLINCNAYDSAIVGASAVTPTKAAFWFDKTLGLKDGSAYLLNCGGGGIDTFSINSDGLIPISLHNFAGNNIPATNPISYLP